MKAACSFDSPVIAYQATLHCVPEEQSPRSKISFVSEEKYKTKFLTHHLMSLLHNLLRLAIKNRSRHSGDEGGVFPSCDGLIHSVR